MDTPGMRELQMSEVTAGVAEVFDDIVAITLECRFTNCTHTEEPECAIQAAIAQDTVGTARFERWRKLTREDVVNSRNADAPPRTTGKPAGGNAEWLICTSKHWNPNAEDCGPNVA